MIRVIDTWFYFIVYRLGSLAPLKKFFYYMSHTGDGHLYVLIGFVVFGMKPDNYESFLLVGCTAFAIQIPAFRIAKNIFKRERPHKRLNITVELIKPFDEFSMPSGHTASAVLMACLLSFYYEALSIYSITYASLIGVSRVALGVHYPGDVIAGAALGYLSFLLALTIG
ncbi:MAG: phosphatase PAP2 family protein [Pseudohongiellaceae bacterium]|jgi:undecaprenyl-diphosphatase|tara:strand:+ start:11236 stop:11742 length:507 start_codon:yes stop_codon:yes gene_type:complete